MVDQDVELELTEDDMYSDGTIVQFDDGTMILQRELEIYVKQSGDDYVQITEGETIDSLAAAYYQTNKKWYKIADANEIFNPFDVPGGTSLIIPTLGYGV